MRGLAPPTDAGAVLAHLRTFLGPGPGVVGAYEVLPGEVDLSPLLGELDAVALPALHGAELSWHLGDGSPVAPDRLDVVLVPGRLFDRRGIRLGRGGGHYDRFLPRLRPGVPAIGVTVDERIVEQLPAEAHDVPMTHLATGSGVRAVRFAH